MPVRPDLNIQSVNYAQISLEEADEWKSNDYSHLNDLIFKPVLIWKPRQHRGSPPPPLSGSRGAGVRAKRASRSQLAAAGTEERAEECEKVSNSHEGMRRSSLTLCKTNLTDTLPPLKEDSGGTKAKVCVCVSLCGVCGWVGG